MLSFEWLLEDYITEILRLDQGALPFEPNHSLKISHSSGERRRSSTAINPLGRTMKNLAADT
jgi:hypothetical protein